MIHRLLITLVFIGLSLSTADAADTPAPALSPEAFVGGRAVPDRERELISLFRDTAARYEVARTARQRSDIRIEMELRISKYMGQSQEATDWLGVVRATHSTEEGDRWVTIEIAPDISLATFQNRFADREEVTLIHKYTPMWSIADQLLVGEVVMFSGTMLILDVTDNDAMVLRPHITTRFTAIKALE